MNVLMSQYKTKLYCPPETLCLALIKLKKHPDKEEYLNSECLGNAIILGVAFTIFPVFPVLRGVSKLDLA